MRMRKKDWVKILLLILKYIADGYSKSEAVARAARKYSISEEEIWRHGGF